MLLSCISVMGLHGVFFYLPFYHYLAPVLSMRPLRPPTSTPVLVPMIGGSCTLPGASNLMLLRLSGALLFASVALWYYPVAPSDLVASKGEWCDLLRSIYWRQGLFVSCGFIFHGFVLRWRGSMASSSFCTLFYIFYLWLQLSLYDRCGRRPVLRCSSQ